MSEELKKINDSNSEKNLDLDIYVKKLVNIKNKLTVVSNILQSSEERLLKIQKNILKDVNSHKAFIEASKINQISATEPDDSAIQ